MATREKVDVVIAGAGAASSVYAALLAEAGKSVVVLETGPARQLTDLYSSQIWARRLKWARPHLIEAGEGRLWFNVNAGLGFGGAAMHHYGIWPRYHQEDMKEKTLYGRGLDWPMDYDELRPHYDQVQTEVGLSGDAKAEIWRPPGADYPMPPVPTFGQAEILAKGFEAMGMHTAPLPLAINTQPYNGRPVCLWDGWCDAGCPTGALVNPMVVYFPRATGKGAVMQADSHVTRVLTNRKGDRAEGVEYMDKSGERHVQLADVVVLAAFSVENVRILLNSATPAHPQGLANSSGTLGRYMTTHPAVYLFGTFKQETQSYMGVTGGVLFNQDRFTKDAPGRAYGSRQWEIAQALKPNDLLGIAVGRHELFGRDLEMFMKRGMHHTAVMASVCEDIPLAENRIELSDRKDRFGWPLAQSVYKPSPEGLALYEESRIEGREIMRAAGATEVWESPMGGQHTMGGTIVGADPATSVANKYSVTHDLPNLAIGGPGMFPTSSSVNSTYTVHALAMMSAQHLVNEWPV